MEQFYFSLNCENLWGSLQEIAKEEISQWSQQFCQYVKAAWQVSYWILFLGIDDEKQTYAVGKVSLIQATSLSFLRFGAI